METKEFKGNYLSLKSRLIINIIPVILLLFVIILLVIKMYSYSEEKRIYPIVIIIIISSLPFLPGILRSFNIVTDVIINNQHITFSGFKFNKKWSKQFNIKEVNVSIGSYIKRSNNDYYLKFKTKDGSYFINGIQNWDYEIVVNLYRNFKSSKGEKVIFDDEYWLDVMEKKANGMTTHEALMSKTSKKIT